MLWLQDVIDSCSLKAPAEVRKPSAVKFPLTLANVWTSCIWYALLKQMKNPYRISSRKSTPPPPPSRTLIHARTLYYHRESSPSALSISDPLRWSFIWCVPQEHWSLRCAGTLAGWDLLAGNRYHCISQDQHWPITGSLGQSPLHWQEAITHLMLKGLISC